MDGKKSFILYCDQIGLFKKLPDEQAGKLIKIIFDYVNDLNPEINDVLLDVAFDPIKLQLKRDLQKWEGIRKARSYAGKASATSRKQKATNPTSVKSVQQKSTNPTVTVNDTVTVNVTVNDINKRKEEFKETLTPYLADYGKDLLNNFFGYWTEHGEKDKKMRFEKQKSFGLARRLSTWKKNQSKFDGDGKKTFSEKVLGKDRHAKVLEQLRQNDIDNLKLEG